MGLPIDLKLRFPSPTPAPTRSSTPPTGAGGSTPRRLVKTIDRLLARPRHQDQRRPRVPDPAGGEQSAAPATAGSRPCRRGTDNFRTHDVGFSGKPAFVRRALALARKFDRPRKQVRVKVRIDADDLPRSSGTWGWTGWTSLAFTANEAQPTEVGTAQRQHHPHPMGNGLLSASSPTRPCSCQRHPERRWSGGQDQDPLQSHPAGAGRREGLHPQRHEVRLPQGRASATPTARPPTTPPSEKTGIYLQVGVQVGLDDDMVLTLYPQVTSLQAFQIINGAKYPIINTVEEQATVRALKGDVIVLGGLAPVPAHRHPGLGAVPGPHPHPGQAVRLGPQEEERAGAGVLPDPGTGRGSGLSPRHEDGDAPRRVVRFSQCRESP